MLNKIFYLTFDAKPPRPLAEYDALLSIGFSFVVSYLAGPGLSLQIKKYKYNDQKQYQNFYTIGKKVTNESKLSTLRNLRCLFLTYKKPNLY